MSVPDIIIAIDGYSSTGKSTFAKLIAKNLEFLYLDSGALYRAITLYCLEKSLIAPNGSIDIEGLKGSLDDIELDFRHTDSGSKTFLNGKCVEKEIRSMEVSSHVSPVSALAFIRNFVDARLREFGKDGRIVMDGRDIGTTVFPQAQLKIFMVADEMTRAQRRLAEMQAKGEEADMEQVLENLRKRDWADSHRETSPLRKADDAIVLDNSRMTLDDQMKWVTDIIRSKFEAK